MSEISPKIIAVDLTSVLPNGANGGAKIFVLALLRSLAEMLPQVQFILLTQWTSHEELVALERENVRCELIRGPSTKSSFLSSHMSWLFAYLEYCPTRVRREFIRAGCCLDRVIKRYHARGLLKRLQADLLFCPFTAPTYADPTIPTVCTIYDFQYKTYPQFFELEDAVYREQVFNDACRKATVLAAISDYSRESALANGKLDLNRIQTIYLRMGQRLNCNNISDTTILDRLQLTPVRYFIYPANYWKHKNHEMLLTAFNIACRSELPDDFRLVCTGAASPRRDFLIQAAERIGLADRVILTGYLSHEDLASLLRNASGMVFPSLYEGFGMPILEGMAAGIPLICSNTTALPEIAGEAALMFDPCRPSELASQMIRLANDRTLAAKYIEAGNHRVQEFSNHHQMANEYWSLFQFAFAQRA